MSFFKSSKDTEAKRETGEESEILAENAEETVTPDASEAETEAPEVSDTEQAAKAAAADGADVSSEESPEDEKPAEEPSDELAVLKDRYARLMADFSNFRKRVAKEYEDTVKRSNARLLEEMLPVLDTLELALSKAPSEEDPMVAGVKMVADKFVSVLAKNGLERIDARGKPFDPAIHEALSMLPSADVPDQTVLDQYRCGWYLHGKLLRPAQVIVSSGAPETAE